MERIMLSLELGEMVAQGTQQLCGAVFGAVMGSVSAHGLLLQLELGILAG